MVNLFQYRSWALEEPYFNRIFPVVAERMKRGDLEALIKKKTAEELFPGIQALAGMDADAEFKIDFDRETGFAIAKVNGSRVALFSMIGPLSKYGDLCSFGMQDYMQLINRVNSAENIDGLVMIMDTPGGTVDGTPELALTVKQSKKPIGVFGDAMVASAGIWIASQASVIVGNKNNPTDFGSIGTLMVMANYQNVIDAGNLPKMEIIRAPQSSEKALVNSLEEMSQETRNAVLQDLKEITNEFINAVKSGRGAKLNTKLDGLFAGKMFDVNTSKQNGLIDAVGTLQTAVNKVSELARKRKNEGSNVSTNTGANEQMKFPKLSNLFSGEAWKKVLGVMSSDEDQATLEATEKKVADQEAENTRLTGEAKATGEKITALEATVSGQAAQITTLEGEKTALVTEKAALQSKLDEKPKGTLTTTIPNADKEAKNANEAEGEKKGQYATSVDADAQKIREDNAKLSTFK